jgi:deoxyribodipyrimidine photo-lyase
MDLAELDIPLHIEVVEPRKGIPSRIVELMNEWDAMELFANIEYEVDELDRDERLIRAAEGPQIRVTFSHDQCVVEPGTIVSGVSTSNIGFINDIERKPDVGLFALATEMDSPSSGQ